MSIRATRAVWAQSRARGGQLLVLLALADHINSDHPERGCWPSVATLARRTRFSKRHVRRCLRELEGLGEITTVKEPKHRTHVYRLHLPGNEEDNLTEDTISGRVSASVKDDTYDRPGGHRWPRRGDADAPRIGIKPKGIRKESATRSTQATRRLSRDTVLPVIEQFGPDAETRKRFATMWEEET